MTGACWMDRAMSTPLIAARAGTCGGKAAALGTLLRQGLPVPDGFVVPFAARPKDSADAAAPVPDALRDALAAALAGMGDPPVAVRSSAANEDTAGASAAGQYESVLGVAGPAAVGAAIRRCWASASASGVSEYWTQISGAAPPGEPEVAVLVQRMIDADASGVMFTAAAEGRTSRIEASWGLGPAVVGGTVTPDTWQVGPGTVSGPVLGHKATRVDRRRSGDGLATTAVLAHLQDAPAIDEPTALALATLGERAAAFLGGPLDIEWAVTGRQLWILQARPITAPAPPLPKRTEPREGALAGTPGGHGQVCGPARVLDSIAELGRVEPGDIVVCRYTDPAWTPLFRIAGGIVTETGGALSHAAIVAREHRIPAVIGVPDATTAIRDGSGIWIDGTAGAVIPSPH